MKFRNILLVLALILILSMSVSAQVRLHGRLYGETFPGSGQDYPFTSIMCFAGLDGPNYEPTQFCTFEIDPVAWYNMSGSAGRYTMLFGRPGRFMRPLMLTNIYTKPSDDLHRIARPKFDYAVFFDGAWDNKPAGDYYQTFVATGTSVTHVGIRPVHDGVDGFGPGAQNVEVSIVKKVAGTPDKWPQVGPTRTIKDMDAGGPKNYIYYAGWNSGEVPLTPGETYAVHVKGEQPFQTFWHPDEDKATDCYRTGAAGPKGWQNADLWMAVGTDNDGLVIPLNKCSNKEYVAFAGGSTKWTQTYVAQGRSLAAAMLSAAVGTAHPSLARTRMRVRVREGGPDGPIVGIQKIAVGNGNYTGDSSWGWFGAVYSPGEVPLVPGETYAIEWETMETVQSLHDYINIKAVKSDLKPGFNPYKKDAGDEYKDGTSYKEGKIAQDFDLDMQVIEYKTAPEDWAQAVEPRNLLTNGRMSIGKVSSDTDNGRPAAWKEWKNGAATGLTYMIDNVDEPNRILRVSGQPQDKNIVDGGYVQRVDGLDHLETYRLTGQLRSTWPVTLDQAVYVGYDPTGQDTDPSAPTIVWSQAMPGAHDIWEQYASDPIRPAKDSTAVSIWLCGKSLAPNSWAYEADFDNFELHQVKSGVPGSR